MDIKRRHFIETSPYFFKTRQAVIIMLVCGSMRDTNCTGTVMVIRSSISSFKVLERMNI